MAPSELYLGLGFLLLGVAVAWAFISGIKAALL